MRFAFLASLLVAQGLDLGALCELEGGCDGPALSLVQVRGAKRDGRDVLDGLLEKDAWRQWLRKTPAASAEGTSPEASYASCSLGAASACSLEDMRGAPTLVYPGGSTQCMNGDEYAFAVVPGAVDKLLFLFEGGGACWEADGSFGKLVVQQCTDSLAKAVNDSGLGFGLQAMSDERNPLRGYTVVEALYCSGDAFVGNTTMPGPDGGTLRQNGYQQVLAALHWAKANLRPRLASLALAGFSAGSLGTMAWADVLLTELPHAHAAVILDSYAGLFPEGLQSATMKRWGACELPIWSAELQGECRAETINVQGALAVSMRKFPSVAFGSIQSKVDDSQLWFYKGIAKSWGRLADAAVTGPAFYRGTNAIFGAWSAGYPNYVLFLVEGANHCFIQSDLFYTASASGPEATAAAAPEGELLLYEWVAGLVREEAVPTECSGLLLDNGAESVTYCDRGLLPKVLVVAA